MILDLEEIRENTNRMLREIETEEFEFASGNSEKLEIARTYPRYRFLINEENIKFLRNLRENSSGYSKRGFGFLELTLAENFIINKVRSLADEENNYFRNAKLTVDGEKILYNELFPMIWSEDDRRRRDMLSNKGRHIDKKLTGYEKRILEGVNKTLRELGYTNYIDFYQTLKEKNYSGFAGYVRKLLIETEESYKEKLDSLLDVELVRAKKHDVYPILRLKKFDQFFPKERIKSILVDTLENMGFEFGGNILLDIEYKKNKTNRACCFCIDVPNDIRIIMNPYGGADNYRALFHEMGHGQFYSNINRSVPFELKVLGDSTISETFALIFESLTSNEEWLKKYTEMNKDELEDFIELRKFHHIFFVRRYGGLFLYELKLHGNDLRKLDNNFEPIGDEYYSSMPTCYRGILTRATKLHYKDRGYLLDCDSGFYSSEYLEAWLLDAQVRSKLREKYGENWFEDESSGEFIKDLMKDGNKYPPIEIAKKIGYDKINPKYLIEELIS